MSKEMKGVIDYFRNGQRVKVDTVFGTFSGVISSIGLNSTYSFKGGLSNWFRVCSDNNIESEWLSILYVKSIIEV